MGAVIITTRSLLWVILTLISTLLVFTAVITPKWLIGATRNSGGYRDASISYGSRSGYGGNSPYGVPYGQQLGDRYNNDRYNDRYNNDRYNDRYSSHYNSIYSDYYSDEKPSVGLFNRCTYIDNLYNCASLASEGWGNNTGVFPTSWKISLFFFIVGLAIMVLTVAMALMSCCIQHCFKKSIFTLAGWLQNIAGVLFVLGLLIYMAGWGTKRVERLCGRDSGSFMTGECSLGWAFYTALFGIVLTFITACLSMAAQKATSSDQSTVGPGLTKLLSCSGHVSGLAQHELPAPQSVYRSFASTANSAAAVNTQATFLLVPVTFTVTALTTVVGTA